MGLGPAFPVWLEAAPPRYSSKEANPKPTEEDKEAAHERPKVKMQYFNASWEKVIKDIAAGTQSQLVADRVPKGSFSRRDKNEYTREEAVRLVNKEIEKLGFRLIEKGEFLVVLDLPSQRPRYERPVVPQPGTSAVAPAPTAASDRPERQFQRVTPASTNEAQEPAPERNRVQQAAYEDSAEPVGPRTRSEELLLGGAVGDRAASGPSTVVVFRARNQRAANLAKHVFGGFRDRAELLEAGRNGLPAFRVRSEVVNATQPALQFAVAIDEDKEELLVDARPKDAESVMKLLRLLDTPTLEAEPIQLVSTTRTACEVAMQFEDRSTRIQAAREQLAKMKRARGEPAANVDQFAQADQPAAGNDLQPAMDDAAANPAAQGPVGDIIGNLKGEVNIESVPDLGVLILKGNQADVDQVMQVIRELEKLSEQTAPKLELLFLKNVNSEALAELLTTVYESLTEFPGKSTQPRQSVAILPVSKPNAILIVAPAADMEGIKNLADELDTPVDPETEFQVFHLETAVATQIEQLLTDFYAERKSLGARVIIRADVRTNSIVVSARPNDLDEVATLIRKMDTAEKMGASQLKVFPLQNAVATELSAVLNLAIQSVLSPPSSQGASSVFGAGAGVGNAQVAEEFRDVRSTVLQFLAIDAAGERMLKSGILADIRITPDPRMNALLVAAPESSLSLIGELIKQLDKPTNQVAEIKVFTLANADAQLMTQQLQALFNVSSTQGGQTRQQTGVQVAGAEDANSSLIPLRFSVDTRTNSVIAIGGADALRVVEAIMLRLDESDVRQRKNTIYRLKNSPSDSIAAAITNFFTSQSDLASNDPNLFSTVEQLEREVIVVSEPVSNSLLISATPRYNDEIMRLIERLDAAPQQVIIQAMLVEVELNDTDEFGIELGFQDSILFNRSIIDAANTYTTQTTTTQNNTTVTQTNIISQAATPGFLFGNPTTPLGNNVGAANSGRVGSQSLSNFSVGRTNGDLGFGGLVLSASSESVSFLLRALSENRQTRVLSRPQIRTLDNQQAQIQQGQNVPIASGVTITNGIANPTISRDDAGVILTVTPRISPDGNVVMQLTAEKSQYNLNSGVPIFTDATTGNVVTAPVKDISTAVTTVSVPSGQTVVMGGLITSRTDEIHRKVPWLGDIPILGYAFRYDYLQTRRTELMIFLTPRIIWDDAESEHIKDVEMARMHFIECEAEEIHGPLRGVPAEEMYPGNGLDPSYPSPLQGLPPGAVITPSPSNTPIPGGVPSMMSPKSMDRPVSPTPNPQYIPTPVPPAPGITPASEELKPVPAEAAKPTGPDVPPPPPEEARYRSKSLKSITPGRQLSDWEGEGAVTTATYQTAENSRGSVQQTSATSNAVGPKASSAPPSPLPAKSTPAKGGPATVTLKNSSPSTDPAGKTAGSPTAAPAPAKAGAVKLGRKSW